MTTTVFVDKVTVIEAPWLNDVNAVTYKGLLANTQTVASPVVLARTVPAYVTGGYLTVFRNGLLQELTSDYAETNTTTLTFVALSVGDVITVRKHPI